MRNSRRGARRVAAGATPALVALFLLSPALQSQTVSHRPCEADTTYPGWRVYTNPKFHFCFRYPPQYHEVAAPGPDEFSSTRLFLSGLELKRLPPDTHGGPVDNKAGVGFVYISNPSP